MHMSDALISPVVGGAMWATTGALTAYCAKKVREDLDQSKVPLMGVLGAFIFAAQMLNFSIPGTGSSGHLGGGLILAVLLGPYAAFLVMASVLTVQALFFADGGLLALGANIFNLGFFAAFIAYRLVYKRVAGPSRSRGRVFAGSLAAAVVALQLGALGVVLETVASGVSALPFQTFLVMMQPIHLGIGVVEGLVTAAVVLFIRRSRPEILERAAAGQPLSGLSIRKVLVGFTIAAVVAVGALSWFASTNPDGLEWSISKVTSGAGVEDPSGAAHSVAASIQEATALLPGYGRPRGTLAETAAKPARPSQAAAAPSAASGDVLDGLVGAAITVLLAVVLGLILRRRAAKRPPAPGAASAA